MSTAVRAIDANSISELKSIVDRDPVRYCLIGSRIEAGANGFFKPTYSDILGYFNDGVVESAVLLGANVFPISTTPKSRSEFADALKKTGRRSSSIVGPANEALDLWEQIGPAWGTPREVRSNQPLLTMTSRSIIDIDEQVRYSTPKDLDILLPACIHMFTEEVGVSPIQGGSSSAYRNRISELISSRRSFIQEANGEVVFKAEVGTVGAGVAQIQGVWVNPKYRGQGIAKPAMATVVKYVLDDIAPVVSLYVNDFNSAALATYFGVGFEQVDTFATVLF
jgi:predicted GNAT family acetyltransferase